MPNNYFLVKPTDTIFFLLAKLLWINIVGTRFRQFALLVILVLWYIDNMNEHQELQVEVERVQTGVRMEKRLLKVLKALAELKDLTLGDLLEGIVLHAFEGKAPFSPETLKQIEQLRNIYGLTLRATDSHKLKERHL
jgi:hypothetical protein